MEDLVRYEAREGVAVLTLNRPEALNAFNEDMVQALRAALVRFNGAPERCAVIHAAGDRAFSSGLDMKATPREYWRAMPQIGLTVDKPLVAAVHGHCIGAGYVLMQMCDLAVAADDTLLSYPEAQIGYSGGMILGVMARVPHKVALEFMLVGERFGAERALQVGMVNRVVPRGQELQEALRFARILADSAPLVVSTLKRFAYEMTPRSAPELAALARMPLSEIESSEDRAEGQAAFRERRKPVFKGR
jgi:enoyl-CoA hydratase